MIKRDECGVLGRPPLIRKAEGTILAQNNMVKNGDADEVAGLTEPCREHTIFRTGLRITGRMIVDTDQGGAIQQDRRFEDFARMDDADRERANGHDVDADDGMFGVQTGDKKLFTIETVIKGPKYGGRSRGIADDDRSYQRLPTLCSRGTQSKKLLRIENSNDTFCAIIPRLEAGVHSTPR